MKATEFLVVKFPISALIQSNPSTEKRVSTFSKVHIAHRHVEKSNTLQSSQFHQNTEFKAECRNTAWFKKVFTPFQSLIHTCSSRVRTINILPIQ